MITLNTIQFSGANRRLIILFTSNNTMTEAGSNLNSLYTDDEFSTIDIELDTKEKYEQLVIKLTFSVKYYLDVVGHKLITVKAQQLIKCSKVKYEEFRSIDLLFDLNNDESNPIYASVIVEMMDDKLSEVNLEELSTHNILDNLYVKKNDKVEKIIL